MRDIYLTAAYLLKNVFSKDLSIDEQNLGDTDTLGWNKLKKNSVLIKFVLKNKGQALF